MEDSEGVVVAVLVAVGGPETQPVEIKGDFLHDARQRVPGVDAVHTPFDDDCQTRRRQLEYHLIIAGSKTKGLGAPFVAA